MNMEEVDIRILPTDTEEERSRKLTLKFSHTKIIAKIRRFSNEIIHRFSEESPENTEYTSNNMMLMNMYSPSVFANGNSAESAGYVSVAFKPLVLPVFEGTCFISVIDSSGNQRFPQTFSFLYFLSKVNPETYLQKEVRIPKYISRETLLASPSDFLPNDILTLEMEINLVDSHNFTTFGSWNDMDSAIEKSFATHKGDDNEMTYYLILDSPVAKYLLQESNFFERMLDTPMTEKENRRMKFPGEEHAAFENVSRILLGRNPMAFRSFHEIVETYIIGDKYDIPIVTETCLCFLKISLSDQSANELIEIADEYKLWNLKEIIENLIGNTDEDGTNALNEEEGIQLKSRVRDREWTYKFHSNAEWPFVFEYETPSSVIKEETGFEFYN